MNRTRLLIGLLLLCCAGCDRGPVDPAPAAERLQDLVFARRDRDMAAVERLVLPARRAEVIQTLTAIDAFVDAADRLQAFLRTHYGAELAQSMQLAQLGQNLGVLSDAVELLDARPKADAPDVVEVAFVARDTPPARYARMVRAQGQWWYDPGEGFDPALPAAFEQMTRDLTDFREDLQQDADLRDRIHVDPQVFIDALSERLAPGLEMLPSGG